MKEGREDSVNWWGDRHSRQKEQLYAEALRQEQEGLYVESKMNEENSSRMQSYRENPDLVRPYNCCKSCGFILSEAKRYLNEQST